MKKVLLPIILCAVGTASAVSIDVPITATSGVNIINGGSYTDYDTVNIKLADGLTFTNTDQRLINAIKNDTVYNISEGTLIKVSQSAIYNALVMGEGAGSTGTVNLYTNMNVSTEKATSLTFQGGVSLNIYSILDATGGKLNMTNANKISVKTGGAFNFANALITKGVLSVDGGTVTMATGALDASTLVSGASLILNSGSFTHTTTDKQFLINGTMEINGGTMRTSVQINKGGLITVNGGKYISSRSQILNGGTFEYHSGTLTMQTIAVTANSNLKIYGNLESGITSFNFRDYTDDGILNLYTNGFNFTTEQFYSSTSKDVNVNIIVEDGYDWANDAIHITNMELCNLKSSINKITIGGVDVNNDDIRYVSDGNTGYYINVVPEPAEWGVLLGALALGGILLRRNRK